MKSLFLNLLGIFILLAILFLFSENKKGISIKFVLKCIFAQIFIAFLLIHTTTGVHVLQTVGELFSKLVGFASYGLKFVFGQLADPKQTSGMIFAINVLGAIVFIGALSSLLNYLRIIPFIISLFGRVFRKVFRTTPLETFICISNMFFGQSDAALFLKDYLNTAKKGECLTIFVAGMGSVSMAILSGYIALGIPANFLFVAIGLVPISSLLVARLLISNDETEYDKRSFEIKYSNYSSVFDAIVSGATDGVKIAISVGASLIAFVALIALLNGLFAPIFGITIEEFLGKIFYPLVYLYGLDSSFATSLGELLGTKMIINEFLAFSHLVPLLQSMDPRTTGVFVVSLCGFANFSSIGMLISALSSLCPSRHELFCALGLKGFLGGFFVCILNGFIVSLVYLI